jgi:hypothetical protein
LIFDNVTSLTPINYSLVKLEIGILKIYAWRFVCGYVGVVGVYNIMKSSWHIISIISRSELQRGSNDSTTDSTRNLMALNDQRGRVCSLLGYNNNQPASHMRIAKGLLTSRRRVLICVAFAIVLWLFVELNRLSLVEFLVRVRIAAVVDGIHSIIQCSQTPKPKQRSTFVAPIVDTVGKDVLWVTMLTPGSMDDMNVEQFELHFQSLLLVGKIPVANVNKSLVV